MSELTNTQEKLIEKLQRYFENRHEYNYAIMINKMVCDKEYEKFIQSISIDRMVNGRPLDKHKYKFTYTPKGDKK